MTKMLMWLFLLVSTIDRYIVETSKKSHIFGQKQEIIVSIEKGETQAPLILKKARSLASALGDESFTASTVSECCLALDVVRRFITCHGESPHLQALNCLDELLHTVKRTCSKQTKISEFFQ